MSRAADPTVRAALVETAAQILATDGPGKLTLRRLTRDVGTSRLAQGCSGQLTTVQVERFTGNLPPIQAFDPPMAAKPSRS